MWPTLDWFPDNISNLSTPYVDLLVAKIKEIQGLNIWPLSNTIFDPSQFLQWNPGKPFPLPALPTSSFNLVNKLNSKWEINWSSNGAIVLNVFGLSPLMPSRPASFGLLFIRPCGHGLEW